MEKQKFKVRASSWGGLFDCAHRWEGTYMLGINKPAGMRAHLGTSVHAGTAIFDERRMAGEEATVEEATDITLDLLRNPKRDVDFHQDNISLRDAEKIAVPILIKYCQLVAPKFDFVGVETTLDPMQIDCGPLVVELTGSMDRARASKKGDGTVIIADIKTGSRVVSSDEVSVHGRSAQTGTYQLMYENTTGTQTSGSQIIGLSTSGNSLAGVSRIFDAKKIMVGTEHQPGLIEIAARMFRDGLFPPNPQSILCSEKYCARWKTCIYHE